MAISEPHVLYCAAAASLSVTLLRWLGKAPGHGAPSASALRMSQEEHAGTAHAMGEALQHLVSLGSAAPALERSGTYTGAVHVGSTAHELNSASHAMVFAG